MNIGDKRTQYIILGAIAGCAALFLLLQFLILPSLASWKEMSAKTEEMRQELFEMRKVIQLRPEVSLQIESAKTAVKSLAANIPLPVLGNYLLGMEESIWNCTNGTDAVIVSIADNNVMELPPANKTFRLYRVRVQVQSGLDDYARLVKNIHGVNPLCSISGINIAARENTPQVHEISFIVSWLVWSDPAKRPGFLMEVVK
ncbi:MAG: hypothetical protein PHP98_08045 [Kiritimatiellae bacterium]|nr:hypothetical protein [Kiritimatiellia bacterium]